VVYYDSVGRERRTLSSPVTIDLSCGCRVAV
jgi:hypothetical protein